ncbi:MAG: trypsin-like peptidase domain-containing protein [Gammaproteobacteria bacterium]
MSFSSLIACRRQASSAVLGACLVICTLQVDSALGQDLRPARPREVLQRGPLQRAELTTVEVFRQSSPSVVFITTVEHVRDFFTRNVMRVPRGSGSGFVWDEAGHIVTNYHVIRGAQEAQVRLADQRSYSARLVGASPEHDLAVLRIEVAENVPRPLPLGTSADLQVGQSVLAIGNPFGFDHTLTTGIVSALDRSIDNDRGGVIEHLIQTDAAINPGNSGGPLLDSAGRLIGVNTVIYSPSGAYAGLGFAVPVDTINRVVPRLIAYGRYIRPVLGISGSDAIAARLLESLGITGVPVLSVAADSPARRAGLRPARVSVGGSVVLGDVILAIDGQATPGLEALTSILDEYEIGDEVELELWRNGERIELMVALAGAAQ